MAKSAPFLEYKKQIEAGEHVLDIAESDAKFGTFLQYRSGLNAYSEHQRPRRHRSLYKDRPPRYRQKPLARWTVRTGQMDRSPRQHRKWFDGCELADILVFNDVQLGAVPTLDVFRKLADRNTFRGAVKGGFTWLSPVSQFTLFQERRYSSSTKKCPKTRNSREKTVTLQ